jgi:hypothetical protein
MTKWDKYFCRKFSYKSTTCYHNFCHAHFLLCCVEFPNFLFCYCIQQNPIRSLSSQSIFQLIGWNCFIIICAILVGAAV